MQTGFTLVNNAAMYGIKLMVDDTYTISVIGARPSEDNYTDFETCHIGVTKENGTHIPDIITLKLMDMIDYRPTEEEKEYGLFMNKPVSLLGNVFNILNEYKHNNK